jgi:hypothetical protein
MLTIKLEGMGALEAKLRGIEKQIPFATSVALNRTAKAIEDAERAALGGGTFDRPKPYTVRATYVKRSTKQNLVAEIGLKGRDMGVPAAEYLHANIKGGARNYKRSELMLQKAGLLPEGHYTVPGAGATLDAYGNMSRGQIVSILSYFRTFGNTALNTKRMNATDRSRALRARKKEDYFVVPVADRTLKLYPGIWQRTGNNDIKPLLLFVTRVQYRAVYDFGGIGIKVAYRTFQGEFNRAIEQALATAR